MMTTRTPKEKASAITTQPDNGSLAA